MVTDQAEPFFNMVYPPLIRACYLADIITQITLLENPGNCGIFKMFTLLISAAAHRHKDILGYLVCNL